MGVAARDESRSTSARWSAPAPVSVPPSSHLVAHSSARRRRPSSARTCSASGPSCRRRTTAADPRGARPPPAGRASIIPTARPLARPTPTSSTARTTWCHRPAAPARVACTTAGSSRHPETSPARRRPRRRRAAPRRSPAARSSTRRRERRAVRGARTARHRPGRRSCTSDRFRSTRRPPTPPLRRRRSAAGRSSLALGTLERRKNLPRLVERVRPLVARPPTRAPARASPVATATTTADVDAAIVRLHRRLAAGVSSASARSTTSTKSWLLHHAAVLAYPSLDEGFGFPLLEAMLAGVPVVASTAGSIPEVAGDGALLVDPLDVDALVAADLAARRRRRRRARRARRRGPAQRRPLLVGGDRERMAALYRRSPWRALTSATTRSSHRPPQAADGRDPMITVLCGGVGAARYPARRCAAVVAARRSRRSSTPPTTRCCTGCHLARPRHGHLHARRRDRSGARVGSGRRVVAGDGCAQPLHGAVGRRVPPPGARGSTSATGIWRPTSTARPAWPRVRR